MVAGMDRRLQWLERGGMPWKRAFMEKGVIISFAEVVRLKARMLMEVVGERLENIDGGGRERESTQRDERGGGKRRTLNVSKIPR